MLNLISSPGGCVIVSVLRADDLDRPLEVAGRFEIGDEVGQPGQRRAPAVDRRLRRVAGLLQLGEPQHRRQRAADLIQHVHRAGLALAQLLDQHDALLQLRLALLELLHLLRSPSAAASSPAARRRSRSSSCADSLAERPVAPADDQRRRAPGSRLQPTVSFWPTVPNVTAFFLARSRSAASRLMRIIGRPPFRSARPTATAAVGTTAVRRRATPSFCGVEGDLPERIERSRPARRSAPASASREAVDARRAAAQHDAIDAIGRRRSP